MFKKRLFGYSGRQVDALIKQMGDDYHSEEKDLKSRIGKLEEDCQLLKSENDADRTKLEKAKEDHGVLMKALIHSVIHKSKQN